MQILDSQKKYLLALTPDELTFTELKKLLGNKLNTTTNKVEPPMFNTTDHFTLEIGEYFNKEKIVTTVGKFIFNKYIVERCGFQDILGYVNEEINKKVLKKLEAKLSLAVQKDIITVDKFLDYIDYRDTLGLQLHPVITPSFTEKTIGPIKEVMDLKEKLLKENKKEIEARNGKVISEIEAKLIAKAKEMLKNDPGMDLYNSGARGDMVNYKEMYIMKGAVSDYITKEISLLDRAFIEGMEKKDITLMANQVIQSIYPKSVAPAESGTLSKAIVAAFQSVTLNKQRGSYCKCKNKLDIKLTESNINSYRGRYISEGNKAIELTDERIPKYVGKTVKMFSPIYDIGDEICNVCAGNMPYLLEIKNIGLNFSRTANAITNMGMKKFHVTSIKTQEIDIDDIFL